MTLQRLHSQHRHCQENKALSVGIEHFLPTPFPVDPQQQQQQKKRHSQGLNSLLSNCGNIIHVLISDFSPCTCVSQALLFAWLQWHLIIRANSCVPVQELNRSAKTNESAIHCKSRTSTQHMQREKPRPHLHFFFLSMPTNHSSCDTNAGLLM